MKFGTVEYYIKGVNQERAFNGLSKVARIYNLKRLSPTDAIFCVNFKYDKQVIKKLDALNLKIVQKKFVGFFGIFIKILHRYGIIAGIFVSIAFSFVLSNFVFSTKIMGIQKLSETEIFEVLQENNYKGFLFKGNLDTSNIEKVIMNNFDKISMVSVIVKGNTLVINIKEKVINDEYENVDNFTPLTSKFDGLITEIKLIQGTLKVKVGDIVKSGDELVLPYIFDSQGEKRNVKAEAEITARVWFVGKSIHFGDRIETVRTGNMKRYVNLTFLGINLTNNLKVNPNYSNYETVVNTTCISKGNILPIYREEILYFETNQVAVKESFEDVKENYLSKAKELALLLVDNCAIITKEYFNVSTISSVTRIEYVIEAQRRIDIL